MKATLSLHLEACTTEEVKSLAATAASLEAALSGFAGKARASASGDALKQQQTSPDKDNSSDDKGDGAKIASRLTYCHDAANKRVFTLEKGDTLPDPGTGVVTVSKSTFEDLQGEYAESPKKEDSPASQTTEAPFTFDEIKAALTQFAKDHGPAAAKAKVSGVGYDKISAVPAEKYQELMDSLKGDDGGTQDEDDFDL